MWPLLNKNILLLHQSLKSYYSNYVFEWSALIDLGAKEAPEIIM